MVHDELTQKRYLICIQNFISLTIHKTMLRFLFVPQPHEGWAAIFLNFLCLLCGWGFSELSEHFVLDGGAGLPDRVNFVIPWVLQGQQHLVDGKKMHNYTMHFIIFPPSRLLYNHLKCTKAMKTHQKWKNGRTTLQRLQQNKDVESPNIDV